jgi:hypothetical protein
MEGKWTGAVPTNCDICRRKLDDTWVDGRTKMGPWANMCRNCHRAHGVGHGQGKGQEYDVVTKEKVKG